MTQEIPEPGVVWCRLQTGNQLGVGLIAGLVPIMFPASNESGDCSKRLRAHHAGDGSIKVLVQLKPRLAF